MELGGAALAVGGGTTFCVALAARNRGARVFGSGGRAGGATSSRPGAGSALAGPAVGSDGESGPPDAGASVSGGSVRVAFGTSGRTWLRRFHTVGDAKTATTTTIALAMIARTHGPPFRRRLN